MNENRKKSTKKARPRKVSKRSDSTDLRNQFAAAALGGILSDPNTRCGNWVDGYQWPKDYDEFCETVVSSALSYADAMLAAIAKAKGGVA